MALKRKNWEYHKANDEYCEYYQMWIWEGYAIGVIKDPGMKTSFSGQWHWVFSSGNQKGESENIIEVGNYHKRPSSAMKEAEEKMGIMFAMGYALTTEEEKYAKLTNKNRFKRI